MSVARDSQLTYLCKSNYYALRTPSDRTRSVAASRPLLRDATPYPTHYDLFNSLRRPWSPGYILLSDSPGLDCGVVCDVADVLLRKISIYLRFRCPTFGSERGPLKSTFIELVRNWRSYLTFTYMIDQVVVHLR